jgi:hypothetical protein
MQYIAWLKILGALNECICTIDVSLGDEISGSINVIARIAKSMA